MSDEQVKRYSIMARAWDSYSASLSETCCNDGKWVMFTDHDRIVSALRAENEVLRKAFRQIKEMAVVKTDSGRNAVTIWLMHNAALAATEQKP